MKYIILVYISIYIACSCVSTISNLNCEIPIDNFKSEFKEKFKADSIVIYNKKLKEELYLPAIHCPVVLVINPTTKILDFKSLPDQYVAIGDYEKTEYQLKMEALPIVLKITKNCDMSNYNDFIVEFFKINSKGKPSYRYICHYRELLE